ncbi:MAG: ubiquinol-cytochrome c reductase iron-sulfur subunit [Gammaproteobacteria bacterium]|nr:ubiquinol-cytochrome c reductase iron-sulfur subunit [Gammaproteobacteria bacterium]MBP9729359.1 ubiquinol-cytochrome c reductase iron-sulfur subunit [Gammaproteobacteria bacterium]
MSAEEIDTERRRFLVSAASLIGGVGAACAAFPFLASFAPSIRARALGAPVEVDITKIEPGQKITVSWRGQPVFIVRRTPQSLADLQALAPKLRDPLSKESVQPAYAANLDRSIKPEILVLIGICTHLGCVPLYKPTPGTVEAGWEGGFFCPCHGSKYDMSGRVYKGVPAPLNLAVPPYQYLKDTLLLIGDDSKASVHT